MTSLHDEVIRASVVKIIIQVLWVNGVAARCGCSGIVIILPRLVGANKAATANKIEIVFVNTWVVGGLHEVPLVRVIMWGVWDGGIWHVMSTMKWNSWVSFITAAGNVARGRSGGFTVLSGQWWNKWRRRHWLAVVEIKWSGIICCMCSTWIIILTAPSPAVWRDCFPWCVAITVTRMGSPVSRNLKIELNK